MVLQGIEFRERQSEEQPLPDYLDMLRMARPEEVLGGFISNFKSSGLLGLLAFLQLCVAWILLSLGCAQRRGGLVFGSMLLSIGAAVAGWAASYFGYLQAAEVVNASGTVPKQCDLIHGANYLALSVVVPGFFALITLFVAFLAALALVRRQRMSPGS